MFALVRLQQQNLDTLSAAASRSAAISFKFGDFPVQRKLSISLKTSGEISDMATRLNLLSSISCSNIARKTGDRAETNSILL